MIQEKIGFIQLFYIMLTFEIGSAVIFGLGAEAKQDAWLVILVSMFCGLILMWMYTKLFEYHPGDTLIQMIPQIVGKFIGYPLITIYILYFIYIASRVTRDFGELIAGTLLPKTPMIIVMGGLMVVIVYCLYGGVEVFGRTGEVFFPALLLISVITWIIIYSSQIAHIQHLTPVLEKGIVSVWKAAFPLTITFPFGEMVVFMMFWPALQDQKKVKQLGMTVVLASGILLTINMINIISVIGPDWISKETYPLLAAVRLSHVGNFIERIDAVVTITMMVGVFFKVGSFLYGAALGTAQLFKMKSYRSMIVLFGVSIVPLSLMIADNYMEHIEIGLKKVPLFLHIPLQIVIPALLLVIAAIRKRVQS
ncbi:MULTISPECIES: GerAB/ArcD/ProY family transporter [Bacillus]|uniref:GerAB/ArcD/ProY family transporter n=1 Tax=Bacillus TaxID=1386 RepID=UPI000330503C|nr:MULTISPECIES: endospore germination permease [Bacillus]EOP17934.1 spore germination protein (amino acid permease) [Bacillus cereus VD131]OFC99053.1 Spore germination protein [Bacillus thuringiensis]KAF6549226.1 endospore germination permease [Bacillus sp. EKM202B]MBJ8044084.1 endospore germination permease [Bacillus cereus group sp. N17]MBJ8067735.1 endospore germination permease [Bacillus cereus group sp. N15]